MGYRVNRPTPEAAAAQQELAKTHPELVSAAASAELAEAILDLAKKAPLGIHADPEEIVEKARKKKTGTPKRVASSSGAPRKPTPVDQLREADPPKRRSPKRRSPKR